MEYQEILFYYLLIGVIIGNIDFWISSDSTTLGDLLTNTFITSMTWPIAIIFMMLVGIRHLTRITGKWWGWLCSLPVFDIPLKKAPKEKDLSDEDLR